MQATCSVQHAPYNMQHATCKAVLCQDDARAAAARRRRRPRWLRRRDRRAAGEVGLRRAVLSEDNIVDEFRAANVPTNVDYVSIDVDTADIWILRALLASEAADTEEGKMAGSEGEHTMRRREAPRLGVAPSLMRRTQLDEQPMCASGPAWMRGLSRGPSASSGGGGHRKGRR